MKTKTTQYKIFQYGIVFRLSMATGVAIIGFGVIFGLLALGFDARFAHMLGYSIALAVAIALYRIPMTPSTECKNSQSRLLVLILMIAYVASLYVSVACSEVLHLDRYLTQAIAAVIFIVVLITLQSIIQYISFMKPQEALASINQLPFRRIGLAVLVLTLMLFAYSDFRAFKTLLPTIAERSQLPTYARVQSWLESAVCFKERGIILARCDEPGQVTPIENISLGDDRGHGLLLSTLHKWFYVPATRYSLVVINALIVIISFSLLAWQLYRIGVGIAALLFWFFVMRYVQEGYLTADSFGAYYGLFALSALLPLQLLRMAWLRTISLRDWTWLGLSGFAMIIVVLMREPFGYIGIVTSAASLTVAALHLGKNVRVPHAIAAIASIFILFLASNASALLFQFRAVAQGVPIGIGSLSHGIAHNLYIGLGSQPNSFGIRWDDASGASAVKAAAPNAGYVTDEYYRVIGKLYFDILRRHPLEVARIYSTNVGQVLSPKTAPPKWWLTILPSLPLSLAAIFAGLPIIAKFSNRPYSTPTMPAAIIIAMLTLLHSAQAVLTVPVDAYFFQVYVGTAAVGMIALDVWFRAIFGDLKILNFNAEWG